MNRNRHSSLAFLLVVISACALVPAARAQDVEIDSDTVLQLYEVRSPGAAAFIVRRRLVQTLGFTYGHAVGTPDPALGDEVTRGPRVLATLRLRLDQDFGQTCLVGRDLCVRATDPNEPATYQPLARDTAVDAPSAFVEIHSLPAGGRARVGRHLLYGPIGLLRIDGASARVAPLTLVAVEAYAGLLVRATSLAGSDAFVPQGTLRLDLDDVDPSRVPFVEPPVDTWAAGADLEVGDFRWARARAGIRELWEPSGVVARRFGASIASQPWDPLRVEGTAVWDLLDGTLYDALASVTTRAGALTIRAGVEQHVPRFDAGSIWGYFDLVPVGEAWVSSSWKVTERLELGAGVRGRRADFGDDVVELDAGGDVSARVRLGAWSLGGAVFAWGGDLAPLAGGQVDVSRAFANVVRVDARASLWHFDDPLRENLNGTSIEEALGATWRLSRMTSVRAELSHAHSAVVGHRFRGLAALSFEVWR